MDLPGNYDPATAADTVDEALRTKWWRHLSVAERMAVTTLIDRGRGGAAADADGVRATLRATGHAVTDSIDRDVDIAIDLERSRREDILMAVALVLGHSRDYARSMKPRHLLAALRDKVLDAERCDACPWPRGTECGGAAGVCEGNARPDVDHIIDRVRAGFGDKPDGPGTLHEEWVG